MLEPTQIVIGPVSFENCSIVGESEYLYLYILIIFHRFDFQVKIIY